MTQSLSGFTSACFLFLSLSLLFFLGVFGTIQGWRDGVARDMAGGQGGGLVFNGGWLGALGRAGHEMLEDMIRDAQASPSLLSFVSFFFLVWVFTACLFARLAGIHNFCLFFLFFSVFYCSIRYGRQLPAMQSSAWGLETRRITTYDTPIQNEVNAA